MSNTPLTVIPRPVALVWHDRGQSAADAIAAVGELDATVLGPTWNPAADDGGRAELLISVREARELIAARAGNPDDLGLIGIGLGAVAAAGLAIHAKRLGIGLGTVWCVAPNWNEPDPISGVLLSGLPEIERVELVDDQAALAAEITRWERAGGERSSSAPSE